MVVKTFLIASLFVIGLANASNQGEVTDIINRIAINDRDLPGEEQRDGTRCVKKVINVEETEFERGMDCQHKLAEKCHLTYITDYQAAPERKCETTFKKDCHITFKPVPHTETVKKCHTPYEKKCGDDVEGPEVCTTQYEDHCETNYKTYELQQDEPNCKHVEELRCKNTTVELLHLPKNNGENEFAVQEKCEKWPVKKCDLERKNVKKVHPETECKKIPKQVCAPSNCETVPGREICHEEEVTRIQNIPEEECDLQPQENCRTESTLVPKLVPKKNCVKVPKEVCVPTKKNPKKVTKPVVKNWCYNPRDLKNEVRDF